MVGGLLVSQLLTLYITPVVYYYMDKFQETIVSSPGSARAVQKLIHELPEDEMRRIACSMIVVAVLTSFPVSAEEIIAKGELLTLQRCIEIALKMQPSLMAARRTD